MHDFKVGDRVICIRGDIISVVSVGDTGTVYKIRNDGTFTGNIISVRWDRYDSSKHSCSGSCEVGHGWDVIPNRIKHTNVLLDNDLEIGDPALLLKMVCVASEGCVG